MTFNQRSSSFRTAIQELQQKKKQRWQEMWTFGIVYIQASCKFELNV